MQQYTQGMIEGTLPYQQLQFQWEQQQKAAKGGGGGGGKNNNWQTWLQEYLDGLFGGTPEVEETQPTTPKTSGGGTSGAHGGGGGRNNNVMMIQ